MKSSLPLISLLVQLVFSSVSAVGPTPKKDIINNLIKTSPHCGQSCFEDQTAKKPFSDATLQSFCASDTSGLLLINCVNTNCSKPVNKNWYDDLTAMAPILQQTAKTCAIVLKEDTSAEEYKFHFKFNAEMAAITIVGPDGKEVVIPKIEKTVGVSVEGGAENAVKPTIQNNSTSHGTETGLNKGLAEGPALEAMKENKGNGTAESTAKPDGNEGNGDKRKTGIIVAACLVGGLVFGVILAIAHCLWKRSHKKLIRLRVNKYGEIIEEVADKRGKYQSIQD